MGKKKLAPSFYDDKKKPSISGFFKQTVEKKHIAFKLYPPLSEEKKKPPFTTMERFFSHVNKVKNLKGKIKDIHQNAKNPPATIMYRQDGNGKGSYFDHYAIQKVANTETRALQDEGNGKSIEAFLSYMKNVTHDLAFGEINSSTKRIVPKVVANLTEESGLVIVPGVSRDIFENKKEEYKQRLVSNYRIMKQAYLNGQPILAICGGAWELWGVPFQRPHRSAKNLERNKTLVLGKIRSVDQHNYRGGMPQIKDSTGKIGHNKQVHRVEIEENAKLLQAAMDIQDGNVRPAVNSVHAYAVDEKAVPDWFIISAKAVQDDTLAPKAADGSGNLVKPEEGSVEAFESKHGAPMLGIQWHPEAYTTNISAEFLPANQRHLILYMIQAGRASLMRHKLVRELKTYMTPPTTNDNEDIHNFQKRILKKEKNLLGRFELNRITTRYSTSIPINGVESRIDTKEFRLFPNSGSQIFHFNEIKRAIKRQQRFLEDRGFEVHVEHVAKKLKR